MNTSKYVPLTATVVVCSITALLLLKRRRQEKLPKQDEVIVDLLPIEKTLAAGFGGDNATSTLTWYRGDYNKVKEILQTRAEEILQANPWLGGRVVKQKGQYVLAYMCPLQVHLNSYFQCDLETHMSRNTPLDKLIVAPPHLLLKNGHTQPLWKITMIPCHEKPETFFAIVFSMSHIIADGATFYKIQNMLTFAEPITSLIATRITDTRNQQIQAMGGEAEYAVLQSPGFIANCIWGVIQAKLFGYKTESRVYLINKEEMNAAKGETDFVSTNDILTSWFLQNSNCAHGIMSLNFRGRLHGHTDLHAGNYENVIFYQRQDSESPSLIRSSLSQFRRVVTNQDPMPSFWNMAKGSVAMSTNWSLFAKPSAIPECREELQVPLYDMNNLLPSTMAIMFIFRAGPHGLAILVAGTPDKLARLEDAPFLSRARLL